MENQDITKGKAPSLRVIPANDNGSAGSTIQSYAKPYKDVVSVAVDPRAIARTPDNLEIIVPRDGDKLYCENAF